jgi:Ala-tRNA(Pro) deacylase
MRVPHFLAEQHVPFETIYHAPAFTAQKRAKYLHVCGDLVAKCVLLVGPTGPILAVLPATRHVDTDRLAEALEAPVRLATQAEVAEEFRDCEWGVVPPFGTLYGLPTLLEASIPTEASLVWEVATHVEAIRMRCRVFEDLERPRRVSFAK